jgi:hypothetical protein
VRVGVGEAASVEVMGTISTAKSVASSVGEMTRTAMGVAMVAVGSITVGCGMVSVDAVSVVTDWAKTTVTFKA